jgi:hypothetical protein
MCSKSLKFQIKTAKRGFLVAVFAVAKNNVFKLSEVSITSDFIKTGF